jgi:hypothetical protein
MAMGRITVSIPDELEATLDAYAKEHHLPVSQVVTRALRGFFEDPPSDPQDPPDLPATQAYLSKLVTQLELARQSVHQMAIAQWGPFSPIPDAVTRALPQPPWSPGQPSGIEES